MKRVRIVAIVGLALASPLVASSPVAHLPVLAQERIVSDVAGRAALGVALRRLGKVGVLLQVTAHPDDEPNAVFAKLSRGEGQRVALLTLTRGNGGQNEIGPELFDDLAVVRTAELQAAHRLDGAEQYFTRAVDFGYSFSVEQTFAKWGKDEILGDVVRMVRTIRPDVITAMRPEGEGGGQHHQASAILAREAFRAAGDPNAFPEQVKQGLRPWQPKKLYFSTGYGRQAAESGDPRVLRVETSTFDALLGRTYAEIGAEARAMHKCQGIGQLTPLPGVSATSFRLAESTVSAPGDAPETSLFDGIDTTVASLAALAGPGAPAEVTTGLTTAAQEAAAAQTAFDAGKLDDVRTALVAGLTALRNVRQAMGAPTLAAQVRTELDTRLRNEEADFVEAVLLAHQLALDVLADDGLVVRGQPVKLTIVAANRGTTDVDIDGVSISGLAGGASCQRAQLGAGGLYTCPTTSSVPAAAALTEAPYWRTLPDAARHEFDPSVAFGSPFRPTPFVVTFRVRIGELSLPVVRPVQYRYQFDLFTGEKRMPLTVVPAFSLRVAPQLVIVPAGPPRATARAGATAGDRIVNVDVVNGTKGPARAAARLEAPQGWTVTPANAPLEFAYEDQTLTVRFTVRPPAGLRAGTHELKATVTSEAIDGGPFQAGYQVVEYPHIERRHLLHPATAEVRIVDVRPPAPVTVGYIMGVGDVVPEAIEALGVTVETIDEDTLAWGNLSKYPVIFTGVRAYERRADLRTYNKRLIEYAQRGGTVVVQYNKFEFNDAQYGPYPAKVSADRVTDENAPVRILAPAHPLFTTPNMVNDATWQGWVQERGLYFLGEKDAQYTDLLELEEPFAYNKGVKRGALVEARVGTGRWLYVGLGLFRQVRAGTPGAYQLLANLVALGGRPARGAATNTSRNE